MLSLYELYLPHCANCGGATEGAYSMIYHDKEKRMMLNLVAPETPLDSLLTGMESLLIGYEFRVVRDRNEGARSPNPQIQAIRAENIPPEMIRPIVHEVAWTEDMI